MIVELGGGKGGLKEYLEHGKKRGRELHRDQLDQRIALAGDLDVFEMATETHGGSGQHYDHITLSFSESHVSDEMLQLAVKEFRDHALAAWPPEERHRIAFYAEAHRPRILSYIHSETGDLIERLTHIHIGLGKHDLLTGESIAPLGFMGPLSDNLKYIDAWQESFNARHGFTSPKDNPKITPENAVDVLSRYTGQRPDHLGTFNEKKAALEVTLQKDIIARNITTWQDFGNTLANYGVVSKMREGKFGECYRIKPHGASRAMRLQGVFFQRQFIERPTAEKIAIVSNRARVAYLEQMQPRKAPLYVAQTLSDWHQFKARENRYLHTGSKFYQDVYKPADTATRLNLLDQLERDHDGSQGSAATQTRKMATARNRVPKMPVRNLDGIQSRTEMLLRDHPSLDVRTEPASQPDGVGVRQTDGTGRRRDAEGDSLSQSVTTIGESGSIGARVIAGQSTTAARVPGANRAIQPSSVLARVQAEMRERYERAADKERYAEIRQHLDAAQLLDRLSHTYGLNPGLYQVTAARDGTPRIQCGSRALSPSDFLTKELGLPWRDAAPILRQTYENQIGKRVTTARDTSVSPQLWKTFKAEQLAEKSALKQRLRAFDDETQNRRAALVSALRTEQTKALAGLTGTHRKAAQSLEKLRAAIAKAEFTDERRSLRKSIQSDPATAWPLFLQARAQAGSEEALATLRKLNDIARTAPAQAIGGTVYLEDDEDEKKRRRRFRATVVTILTLFVATVEINGDVTYSLQGRPVLRDEGWFIAVLDQNSEEVIAAALLLAREKFGPNLALTGSPEFQRRVAEVAAAQGIAVKFVDPQIEALRQRLSDDLRQVELRPAHRSEPQPATEQVEQPISVLGTVSTQETTQPRFDSDESAEKTIPAQTVVIPVDPPQPEPVMLQGIDDMEQLDVEMAKSKLVADLQGQGREVHQAEDGIQYLGKITLITERFAVQSLGRNMVVIHDLAQLDGSYAQGQESLIAYHEGRGQDLRQGHLPKQPGHER